MANADTPLEEYLYEVLRRATALVPLGRLSRQVREERGGYDAAPARLRSCLDRCPDRFLVVEPAPVLPGVEGWPEAVRARYAAALEADAGPLVAARRAPAEEPGAEAMPAGPLQGLEGPLVETLAQLQGAAAAPELAQAARAVWSLLATLRAQD